jgi:hypothetical protein
MMPCLRVRSRMIPNLFMEKFRFLFLPILQGLYGSFMSGFLNVAQHVEITCF